MSDNAIMSIKEQIKAQVANLQQSMTVPVISLDGGKFKVGNLVSDQDQLDVVILAFTHQQAYWKAAWRSGNAQLPECTVTGNVNHIYAEKGVPPLKLSYDDLVPHAPAEGVDPQAKVCGECPNNTFIDGVGRACKHTYQLAVLPINDPTGQIHRVRVSATGMKFFNRFLANLSTKGKTWLQVGVTLYAQPAGSGYTIAVDKAGFDSPANTSISELPDELFGQFANRMTDAENLLKPRQPQTEAAA